MPKTLKAAAVQMDASPAPTPERLERASRLISDAAQAGAQLVVLPELFNTGYSYSETNYRLAEPLNGPTCEWMKANAARLDIHLVGSLLLREQDEIYNSLLLFSPTGQMWRYDKNYPWAWERAYYRERRGTTVAHTALGDIGMLTCWDIGHPHLWKEYAGRVDMMVIASCPPDGTNPTYSFPDGAELKLDNLGPFIASMKDSGKRVFGDMANQQAAWLGVPTVNGGGSGHLQTRIPRGAAFLWSLVLGAPWLIKHLPRADQMQMSCAMIPSCKVVGSSGQVLAERTPEEGEGFTLAEVALPEAKRFPSEPQPASPMSRTAYLSSDFLIPFLMKSVYRKGLREAR